MRLRRRIARYRAGLGPAFHEGVESINTAADLDCRLLTGATPSGRGRAIGSTVVRTPMSPGRSSHFLNRVDILAAGEAPISVVEKGVDTDGGELSFWREARLAEPRLRSELYGSVEPLDVVFGRPVSVMYFPYVPELDQQRKVLRRRFRASLEAIVAAVADFNGRNVATADDAPGWTERLVATRPARSDLQHRLNLTGDAAKALRRDWDEAHDAWEKVSEAYKGLPRCLCHNDVSPGNAVYASRMTTLADFCLAGPGPAGSDLHTLIRWSGRGSQDPEYVESLLRTYVEKIRAHDSTVSLADVRLSAWATYFLRYTNLKHASARHLHAYSLAVRQMSELTRG